MNNINAHVGFRTVVATSAITRSANTTAYAAGDAISNATDDAHFEFGSASDDGSKRVSRPGVGTATINSLMLHSSANQATKLSGELWLFWKDITKTADNGAFAPSDAEMLTLVAIIPIPDASWKAGKADAGSAGNAVSIIANIDTPIVTSGNGRLYGQLVARDAYTPASGEKLTCSLQLSAD